MASLDKLVKSECYTKTQICHCCLSSNRILRPIIEYQQFLNILIRLISDNTNKKSRSISKYFLCWECIAILRKIDSFQRKAIKAQTLLNLNKTLNFSSLSNLSKNTLEPTSYDYTAEIYAEEIKLKIEFEKEELPVIPDIKEDLWDFKDHPEEDEDTVDNTEFDIDTIEVEKPNPKLKIRKVLKSNENYEVVVSELNVKCSKLSTTIENNKLIMEQIRNSDWFKKTNYNCMKCVEIFRYKSSKTQHLAKFHSKNATHVCDSCDSRFHTKERLDEHFKTHFFIYKCSVCPTVTTTESQNKKHFSLNHCKTYCCKKCSMAFGKIEEFSQHHKEVHEKYVCDKCGKTCLSKEKLVKHIKHNHSEHHCQPCKKSFKTYNALHCHRYRHHSDSGNSYCVECDKQFSTIDTYRQHLQSTAHQPRKLVPCPECDKRYCKKNAMMNHYKYVHLGKSKHCCVHCNRMFLSSTRLLYHVRKIHEQKPFPKDKMCKICGRGFTDNRILIHHIRTHTGERPYECAHCPATFAQKVAMRTHVKSIHMKYK